MAAVVGRSLRHKIISVPVRAVHAPSAGEHSGLFFITLNFCYCEKHLNIMNSVQLLNIINYNCC